ncbi:MAG: CBS domain-containing protein [Acidobacteria bacterium]|nr:CBS domain-containing protein [Acidobacteriota bacterium]
MKVSEVMTKEIESCGLADDLTKAAEIMWKKDCGIVPVTDAENRVVGVVTDRDIAIAAASRDRKTSEIRIGEMSFRPLKTCVPDDDLKNALRRMRKYKLRRLCVVNEDGTLAGVLSVADVLRAAHKKSIRKLLFSTLDAIARPAPIVLEQID